VGRFAEHQIAGKSIRRKIELRTCKGEKRGEGRGPGVEKSKNLGEMSATELGEGMGRKTEARFGKLEKKGGGEAKKLYGQEAKTEYGFLRIYACPSRAKDN